MPNRQHTPLQNGSYVLEDGPFSDAELNYVLARIKNEKSPGVDNI